MQPSVNGDDYASQESARSRNAVCVAGMLLPSVYFLSFVSGGIVTTIGFSLCASSTRRAAKLKYAAHDRVQNTP